jgi:amino-acid N-acetyltransferase
VGTGSLLIIWRDLAEIRSLVVNQAYQGNGLGHKLVGMLLAEAKSLDVDRVFALTRKPGFFLKLGFRLTRIEKLPRKVQRDCVFCPKFHACDEVAVVMPLNGNIIEKDESLVEIGHNGRGPQPVIPLIAK